MSQTTPSQTIPSQTTSSSGRAILAAAVTAGFGTLFMTATLLATALGGVWAVCGLLDLPQPVTIAAEAVVAIPCLGAGLIFFRRAFATEKRLAAGLDADDTSVA